MTSSIVMSCGRWDFGRHAPCRTPPSSFSAGKIVEPSRDTVNRVTTGTKEHFRVSPEPQHCEEKPLELF